MVPAGEGTYPRRRTQIRAAGMGWRKNRTAMVTAKVTKTSPVFQLGRREGKHRRIIRPSHQPRAAPRVLVIRSFTSVARRVNICKSSMAREKPKLNRIVREKDR